MKIITLIASAGASCCISKRISIGLGALGRRIWLHPQIARELCWPKAAELLEWRGVCTILRKNQPGQGF